MRIDIGQAIDLAKPVGCPCCKGVALMRQRYSKNQKIMIDKCQICGGIWLDFGELFEVRSGNPPSAETRASSGDLLRGLQSSS